MLEAEFRDALEGAAVRGGRLLLAVSGGRDSVVLLDLASRVAAELELEGVVAHVDHQLRGADSDADACLVRELAERAGLAFVSRRVAPAEAIRSGPSRVRPTLEEAARELRREALLELAREQGARWIATAHHAGDQAETVLLRILRGTGPEGLAAMGPRSADGLWVRPLLGILPDRIADHAAARGLVWREDASNRDRAFARNRLRLDWLPALAEQFNPQLLRTLCHLAETQRRDVEWIETLVDQAARGRIELGAAGPVRLVLEGWDALPEALARRLVRRALLAAGLDRDLSRTHLARALAFLRRGREIGRDKTLQLPRGLVLRRGREGFELGPARGPDGSRPDDDATVHERD